MGYKACSKANWARYFSMSYYARSTFTYQPISVIMVLLQAYHTI